MIIHNDKNIKITFDPNKKRLTQVWKGFALSETFRLGIDKTVSFVKENNVETLLSDALKQSVVKIEDANYAASVMPQLMKDGLKAMAFVVPESIFTKFSLEKFSNTSKENIQYFLNKDEAENWLNK